MTAIRLSPSGPVIGNTDGGPLSFGPGARLRLVEANSIMGGSLALPTVADVISPSGFGNPAAIVLTLPKPKAEYQYRAKLALDIQNTATNAGGEAALFLDLSIDGGTTYLPFVANAHLVKSTLPDGVSRQCSLWLPLTAGSLINIVTDTTPSIKLRARAQATIGNPILLVNSSATATGLTGLAGTIHMELEECF